MNLPQYKNLLKCLYSVARNIFSSKPAKLWLIAKSTSCVSTGQLKEKFSIELTFWKLCLFWDLKIRKFHLSLWSLGTDMQDMKLTMFAGSSNGKRWEKYRITEWLRLERTSGHRLCPPILLKQGQMQQVAQNHVLATKQLFIQITSKSRTPTTPKEPKRTTWN